MSIESKLEARGLTLPQPLKAPPGVALPFSWVRVRGHRAFVSGHVALKADGSIAEPLGKVGAELTLEQGRAAAQATGLAILASLKRELRELDRITAWLRVFGMVNAAPTFDRFPLVINGFSELILELFGPDRGDHARSAVGMAGLPFGTPVEIEAEVEIQA
jgi:enamine deaminase RidA (YjgF/YER057c/UK114 family)